MNDRKYLVMMNHEQAIKQKIRQQLEKVSEDLKGYTVIIFGSRAVGCAHERSDFDVGIIGQQPISLSTFYHIEDLFDAMDTLYTIDWVDLNRASPSFRQEAMKTMEILYAG
jgi:predicted nucleotidyltransferase